MGLFDRLRDIIGAADQPAAPASAIAGQARAERLAAMRAEARLKRRKDMRERLAALIDASGTITGALVKFVNLQPIADEVGAERWAESFARIELMSESVIEREAGEDTLYIAHGTQGFLLLFTQAELEDDAADDLCDTVFDEIRRLLLGDRPVPRPRYSIDARYLLKMIDENTPFPFFPATRPPRERRIVHETSAPAAAAESIAATASAAAPEGATDGLAWEEWHEESHAPGELVVGTSGERVARDAEFDRSTEHLARDVAVEESRERGMRDIAVGRAEERAKSGPEWKSIEDRSAARSEDRGEAMSDGGMGRDRAAQEWFFGRARPRGEIETEARYVPMGRSGTMFAALTMAYRAFLETRRGAVTSYLLKPALGPALDAAGLVAQATRYGALPALDLAVLDCAMSEIGPRFESGVRFLYLVPISFATVMRRADRFAYFDRWATVPASMRKFARFYCYQPCAEIGDTPLQEIATMLRFASREPVFALAPAAAEMRRLGLLRVRSMMLDCAAAPAAKLDLLGQAARQSQLTLYVAGTSDRARRRAAFAAGAAFVEGRLLAAAATIPARPERLSVAGFIDEG